MGTKRHPPVEVPVEKEEEILAESEFEDWESLIRDVRPLSDRGEGEVRADLPEVGLAERLKERQERAATSPESSLFKNLDRRTAERLKRGQIPIESQLDLHGFTQEEALHELAVFLTKAIELNHRCLLVITGKGTAREGGGVLRTLIPGWLAEGAYKEWVLAVERAQPRHGGDGALYVLMHREREF
ncbi:MAG: Smr/MutS family protein [Alphaproteobacteria bacterium]